MYDESAFYTIENLDDLPFIYRFHNREITLHPNQPKAIPFEQMIRICGDPRSNADDRNKLRRDAVDKLKAFYGIYDDAEAWKARPKLKVTDEEGVIVSTPLWDPEGSPTHVSEDPYDYDTMMNKVARHERELASLKSQMEQELRAMQAKRESEARSDIAPTPTEPVLPDSIPADAPVSPAPTQAQSRRVKSRPAVEEPTQNPGAVKTDAPSKTPVS